MNKEIVIDGDNFSNLDEFYDEVESKLTRNLDFRFGRNLDAFNDILAGGFGVFGYEDEVTLFWLNSKKSSEDLGRDSTIEYLENSLKVCHPANIEDVQDKLEKMRMGVGETLYEIIINIIEEHDHLKFEKK